MKDQNKNQALASRIKRMMQADEDVGKIVKTTPLVMAKALELFLTKLFEATKDTALAHGASIISPVHLKAAVEANETFDFLEDLVKGVPDLPAPPDPAELAAKLLKQSENENKPKKKKKKASGGAKQKEKKTATTTAGKKKKREEYESEEEEVDDDDDDETDKEDEYNSEEESEEKPVVAKTTSRSGRQISTKSYAEEDVKKKTKTKTKSSKKVATKKPTKAIKTVEEVKDEEEEANGNLGSFDDDFQALPIEQINANIAAEEDDYD